MRFFINYSYDMLRKKTERINLSDVEYTDQLISQIQRKLDSQDMFYIRFMIDGEYVRVISGWPLAHYGIKHGSTLHIEFYQSNVTSVMAHTKSLQIYPVQTRKLSKIEEDIEEEEENIRVRQDTALSKTSGISSLSNEEECFDDDLYKLLKAAKDGDLKEVKALLEINLKLLNELGDSGWAIIHYAVFYDHIDILKHLISLGADPNLVTSDGWNPLQLAIKKKSSDAFDKLVKTKGIDINKVTQKGTSLHVAVKLNLQKFVDALVSNKADDSLKDQAGRTPADICEDDDIRMSLFVPERFESEQEDKQKQSLSIYKGVVYRVKFLIYSMEENYLVCDPVEGTLKRYQNKSNYPKKPKQIIPLLQVKSFQMLKKQDKHILMRKGFEYFEIFCPDRLMLATKSKQLSIRWIKAIFQSHMHVHNNKLSSHSQGSHHKLPEIQLMQQQVQKLKIETKGFKKEKQKEKKNNDTLEVKSPTLRRAQSIFTQHLNQREALVRVKSEKLIPQTTPTKLKQIPEKSIQTEDVNKISKQQQVAEVKVSSWEEEDKEASNSIRSSVDSYQSNSKKDNSSTIAEESKIGISSFQIIREIGSGSFGKVFLARLHRSKEIFALKALKKSALILRKQLKYAIGEANVLKKLNSPFIVQLYYAFQTPHYLYLCMDYCPNGDLSQYLVNQQDGIISEKQAKLILGQLILAVQHMHQQNIIYRDMKPENVLIGSDGFIRLADFGLSRVDVINNHCASFCGSPAYLSPEMLKQKGVGKESDVYGLGCILYEMLTGEPPYYNDDMEILYENIQKGNLKFPGKMSGPAKDLIQKFLQRDPLKRISLQKVKQHSFFKQVDFGALQRKQIGKINVKRSQKQQDSDDDDIKLSESKKPIFIDADYPDDKKINKVSNFSFSRG